MKKVLLLAVFAFSIIALQAQIAKKVHETPQLGKGLQVQQISLDAEPAFVAPYKPYNSYTANKGIQSITKVELGSSANPYSILLSSQQCLTYSPDLDLIMFSHRQDHTNPGNSGYIQATFSTDGGANWDNNIVYEDAVKLGRYPSGVIYNPAGNTNVDDAYAVVSGPYTDGAGWKGNLYGSMKFDGTAGDIKQVDDANIDYVYLVRDFMQVDDQGRVRVMGNKNTDDGQYYLSFEYLVETGVFNSGTNAWTWTPTAITPDFTVGSSGNPDGSATAAMAWSSDGEIGYVVFTGRNANAHDPLGYHPMIYKTDDAGVSWTLQPGFDWTNIPAIEVELVETNTAGVKKAYFAGIEDAVVDANGDLHFSTFIYSSSSTHPDSLGYIWLFQGIEGIMYHCWSTATGWDADVIDIQYGEDVGTTDSPIGVAWWNRLQMSKTPAEDMIVFAWMDTDEMFADLNLFPDVITQVYNVTTGERTVSRNLTAGTIYDGNNYFMYLSNWSGYDAASNEVILHITTSEFGNGELDPVYHYYLQGARVFADISEPAAASNLSFVSQNYPNPFNGTTSIDITLSNASDVTVEVFNMLGQKVSGMNTSLTAGTHTLALAADNLRTGIYFYTVRAGNNAVTHKMIVH